MNLALELYFFFQLTLLRKVANSLRTIKLQFTANYPVVYFLKYQSTAEIHGATAHRR